MSFIRKNTILAFLHFTLSINYSFSSVYHQEERGLWDRLKSTVRKKIGYQEEGAKNQLKIELKRVQETFEGKDNKILNDLLLETDKVYVYTHLERKRTTQDRKFLKDVLYTCHNGFKKSDELPTIEQNHRMIALYIVTTPCLKQSQQLEMHKIAARYRCLNMIMMTIDYQDDDYLKKETFESIKRWCNFIISYNPNALACFEANKMLFIIYTLKSEKYSTCVKEKSQKYVYKALNAYIDAIKLPVGLDRKEDLKKLYSEHYMNDSASSDIEHSGFSDCSTDFSE